MTGSEAGSFLVTKVPSGSRYVALRTLGFNSAEESRGEEGEGAGVGSVLVNGVPSGKQYVACRKLGLSKAEDSIGEESGDGHDDGSAGSVLVTSEPSGNR